MGAVNCGGIHSEENRRDTFGHAPLIRNRFPFPTMLPPRLQSRRRSPDDGIRQTDGDASQARLSAVRKSYLRDPFISFLVPQPHLVPTRPPLINIGTYTRSEAIDELIVHWINSVTTGGSKVQMISIGAGSDTRFWRLAVRSLWKVVS